MGARTTRCSRTGFRAKERLLVRACWPARAEMFSYMMSAQKIGLVSLAGFSDMQSCTGGVRLVVRRAFYRKMSFKR